MKAVPQFGYEVRMTPKEAFAAYKKTLLSPGLTVSQMESAEREFFASVDPTLRDQYVEPLDRMVELLPTLGFGKATTLVRSAVSLAYMTGHTTRPLDAIAAKLVNVIRAGRRFIDAVSDASDLDEEAEPGPEDLIVGPVAVPEAWWRRFGEDDAEAVWAFRNLDAWLNALASLVVRDRAARLNVRERSEVSAEILTLCGVLPAADKLRSIVLSPDREVFRVIHFPTKRVFDVELDQVGINFELHVLLLAQLAAPLGLRRPPQHSIDVTTGAEDRPNPPDVEGTWEFFKGSALRSLFERRAPGVDQRIWNEGIPWDIQPHQGTRLIVAAPASARSTWGAGRAHFESKPSAKLVAELSEHEATRLIEQLTLSATP